MVILSSKNPVVQHFFSLLEEETGVSSGALECLAAEEQGENDRLWSKTYRDVLGVSFWPRLTLSAGLEAVANCVSRYNVHV